MDISSRGRRHWQHTPINPEDFVDFTDPDDEQLSAHRGVIVRRVGLRPYFVPV